MVCALNCAAVPAFPGAEGPGAGASGGRGGTVYHVTSLQADGPGSLADAVSRPNRIVVFDVSGMIDLTTTKDGKASGGRLRITQPNLTLAGQTAPGEGICLKGGALTVDASNVIIRHLRVRRGFVAEGDTGDAVEMNPKDPGYVKPKFKGTDKDRAKERLAAGEQLKPVTDVIFDHVSASWATDENFTLSGHIDRVHAQYCFIAEALDYTNPKQTPQNHAFGSLFGGAGADTRVGMHHSIFAHHRRRTPQCSAGDGSGMPPVVVDFRNNIVYDSIEAFSHTGGHPIRLNFVNNYYKPGPGSGEHLRGKWFTIQKSPDSQLHAAGNFIFGNPVATADNWQGILYEKQVDFTPAMVVVKEFEVPHITTQSAEEAFESDLQNAGATLPSRDAVDSRVAQEIRTGTGKVIQLETDFPADQRWPDYRLLPAPKDSDGDGLPDFWEKQFGLNPGDASDSAKLSGGYANIEHYFNNTDPDGGTAPVVFVSASTSRARANRGQPGEWRVTRTGDTAAPLTVRYTLGGDAEPGKDFAPLTGAVTIPAGRSFAAIPLAPLPGARDNKTAVITLTASRPDFHIGCPSQSLVVIRH
jgi:hypothetical protein